LTPEADAGHERPTVEAALGEVRRMLAAHAGGVDLVQLTDDGTLRLRFSGMCTGCMLRPLTTASVVRPRLVQADGVREVEIVGGRVSAEAEARLAAMAAAAQRQHPSPRHASTPSFTATPAISRPTAGSSHQAPTSALPSSPTSKAPAR
jgi:Fe-S cluster biogenesis protein NfuA